MLVMADSHVDPKGHESFNKNYITKKISLKNCGNFELLLTLYALISWYVGILVKTNNLILITIEQGYLWTIFV